MSSQRMNHVLSAVALVGLTVSLPGDAAVVVNSLPYQNTPDWVDIVFSGTSMTTDGTTSTLATAQYSGVWFGWGVGYSNAAGGWAPGTSAQGNYLYLDAAFSANAADWSAYFYDKSHYAAFLFNGTGCNNNCYGQPHENGVRVYHASGTDVTQIASTFLPLDLSQVHSFEWLLKNGQVSYRVDGQVIYAGLAYQFALSNPLLLIGDGSGPTATGVGTMTIHGVAWDNAPTIDTLTSAPVPEPHTWGLLLAGLALVGLAARRREVR